MNNYAYIYLIQNLVNNKFYVGQTTQSPEIRWEQHIRSNNQKLPIAKAIQKYKKHNFKFIIIDKANNQQELNFKEDEYICLFQSNVKLNGYNIRNGGSKGKLPKETRQKISKSTKEEKSPCWINLDEEEIINLYLNGESCTQIAKKLRCHHKTILRRLEKNKIKRRTPSENSAKHKLFGFIGAYYSIKHINPWKKVWRCLLYYNNKTIHLGLYNDPLSCEIVYDIINNEIRESKNDREKKQ